MVIMGKPLLPTFLCPNQCQINTLAHRRAAVRRNLGGRPRGCSGLGLRRRSDFGGYAWQNFCFPYTYDLTKAYGTHYPNGAPPSENLGGRPRVCIGLGFRRKHHRHMCMRVSGHTHGFKIRSNNVHTVLWAFPPSEIKCTHMR
jgi:hypothetical protein